MTRESKVLFPLAILTLVLFRAASSDAVTARFLENYFSNKNVMITASLCRSKGDLIKLQRNLQVINPSSHKQLAIYHSSTNSHFFHHLSRDNYFVIDLRSCRAAELILEKVNSSNLFRYPLKYLLLVDDNVHQQLIDNMKTYSIYPISNVVVGLIKTEEIIMMQYYRIGKGTELISEIYGKWTPNSGLVEYYNQLLSSGIRRKNLRQFELVVDIQLKNNYSTLDYLLDYRFPQDDGFTQQDYPIFDLLRQYINATYRIKTFAQYGYINKTTKEVDGIVGDLKYQRADLAGVSIYLTPERLPVLDYMTYINPLPIRFIVRKPSMSYVKNIFTTAFRKNLWLSCFIVLLIFAVCTRLILNREEEFKKNETQVTRRFTLSDTVLISLEALCQQGTAFETRSISGRTVFLVLFTAFMAIYVAYSAYIVVLLQSTVKIESLNELLQSRIAAGGEETNYMRTYFERQKSGVLRDIYTSKIYPDQYYDIVTGLKKVQSGNFAFHVRLQGSYAIILKMYSAHDICGIQELPGYMERLRGYSIIPKNSAYKEVFKIGLLKIDEHGMRRRSVEKMFIKPKCYIQGASFQYVGFYDCYEIFAIWSSGVAIAVIICLLENVLSRLSVTYSSRWSDGIVPFKE